MRISFAGPIARLDPIVIVFDTPGLDSFDKTPYSDYVNYDVIVIGGGGGKGGGLHGTDPDSPTHTVTNFGGQGGGGGLHRIRGLLEFLDDITEVVIGDNGNDGDDGVAPTFLSTDGDDGGSSLFGEIVKATGGMGGRRSHTLSHEENVLADGGDGGIGGLEDFVEYFGTRFAGAKGGVCGLNDDPESIDPGVHVPGTDGEDGILTIGPVQVGPSDIYTAGGIIGLGGGGGAGGQLYAVAGEGTSIDVFRQSPFATSGGKGSYNSEEIVYSPGSIPEGYIAEDGLTHLVKPGRGGGGRITPITGSKKRYGDSGESGVVAIRLTV